MPRPSDNLAESLEVLHGLQQRKVAAIRSANLTRTHRERLLMAGFLQEVIKGRYAATAPDQSPGGSMHAPLRAEGAREAMPTFFELLRAEPDPATRAVLGHFIFVYIHPYMDGNGPWSAS